MQVALGDVNWPAVLVAAAVAFAIGGAWYGGVFGRAWIRLHGYTEEQVASMRVSQGRTFLIMFGSELVMAAVLAVLIEASGAGSVTGALVVALLAAGIALMTDALQNAAHRKSLAAYALDAGHTVVIFAVMGLILGAWR